MSSSPVLSPNPTICRSGPSSSVSSPQDRSSSLVISISIAQEYCFFSLFRAREPLTALSDQGNWPLSLPFALGHVLRSMWNGSAWLAVFWLHNPSGRLQARTAMRFIRLRAKAWALGCLHWPGWVFPWCLHKPHKSYCLTCDSLDWRKEDAWYFCSHLARLGGRTRR